MLAGTTGTGLPLPNSMSRSCPKASTGPRANSSDPNVVTLNFSYCWESTKICLNPGLGIHIVNEAQFHAGVVGQYVGRTARHKCAPSHVEFPFARTSCMNRFCGHERMVWQVENSTRQDSGGNVALTAVTRCALDFHGF